MTLNNLPRYAPVVLRISLAAVFAWIGVSQQVHPSMWTGFIPDWILTMSGVSARTFVTLNGAFEIIASFLLVVGMYVRWVGLALFLHLVGITISIGNDPIGIRDFGLTGATLAMALFGADEFTLEANSSKK